MGMCAVCVTRVMAVYEFEEGTWLERMMGILNNWSCMSFSWCLLTLSRWWSSHFGIDDPIMFRVVVALNVSLVSFMIITVLDKLGDGDLTSDAVENALRQMILALGILVGFGWEQSFDQAVDAMGKRFAIF